MDYKNIKKRDRVFADSFTDKDGNVVSLQELGPTAFVKEKYGIGDAQWENILFSTLKQLPDVNEKNAKIEYGHWRRGQKNLSETRKRKTRDTETVKNSRSRSELQGMDTTEAVMKKYGYTKEQIDAALSKRFKSQLTDEEKDVRAKINYIKRRMHQIKPSALEAKKQRMKNYYEKNRDKFQEFSKKYYRENPEAKRIKTAKQYIDRKNKWKSQKELEEACKYLDETGDDSEKELQEACMFLKHNEPSSFYSFEGTVSPLNSSKDIHPSLYESSKQYFDEDSMPANKEVDNFDLDFLDKSPTQPGGKKSRHRKKTQRRKKH